MIHLDEPKRLGAQLRTLRAAAGFSQPSLARVLGTTKQNISRIERGVGSVTVEDLIPWVHACGGELLVKPGLPIPSAENGTVHLHAEEEDADQRWWSAVIDWYSRASEERRRIMFAAIEAMKNA
jgi:transcriptional regulator with XRE-family HTH domain